jgi:ribosomal protein S17E
MKECKSEGSKEQLSQDWGTNSKGPQTRLRRNIVSGYLTSSSKFKEHGVKI